MLGSWEETGRATPSTVTHTHTMTTDLKEDDKVLGLALQHDMLLKVPECCHTEVCLVVHTHDQHSTDVQDNVPPVQVVPKALLQPVHTDLYK